MNLLFPQLYLAFHSRWLPHSVLHPRPNIPCGVRWYWGRQVVNSGLGMLCHSFPRQGLTTQIWRHTWRVSVRWKSLSQSLISQISSIDPDFQWETKIMKCCDVSTMPACSPNFNNSEVKSEFNIFHTKYIVVYSMTWPLNDSEAGGDLVWHRGPCIFSINDDNAIMLTSWHLNEKRKGLCQSKVISGLTRIYRPGNSAHNCNIMAR